MIATIHHSTVNGRVQAPASKSSMQRAVAAAYLSGRKCVLHNPGDSEDDRAALNIIRSMGANIERTDSAVTITPGTIPNGTIRLHCGESGLSARMFTIISSLLDQPVQITGEGSLLKRPFHFFDEVMPRLSVKINSSNGYLPIELKGPLVPADMEIDSSLSSQFLTGLLMAYSVNHGHGKKIMVKDLKSKPYVDLTIKVIDDFGLASISHKDHREFSFSESAHSPSVINYTIEGDWSGASFLLVAAAIAGQLQVVGLDPGSLQADRVILDALKLAGVHVELTGGAVSVKSSALYAFDFDATHCPDLFPPLTALAASCGGITRIKGVSRLANKESDRGMTLQSEFRKMGVNIEIEDDVMLIHGGGRMIGTHVSSHHDHRIAMALAVAGIDAEGQTSITDAYAINKSYPGFFSDLQKIGVALTLDHKNFS